MDHVGWKPLMCSLSSAGLAKPCIVATRIGALECLGLGDLLIVHCLRRVELLHVNVQAWLLFEPFTEAVENWALKFLGLSLHVLPKMRFEFSVRSQQLIAPVVSAGDCWRLMI